MESIHFNNGIVNWFDNIGSFDGITLHYRQATIDSKTLYFVLHLIQRMETKING